MAEFIVQPLLLVSNSDLFINDITGLEPLQKISDALVETFASAGLLARQQHERVKLHLTVINTAFRRDVVNHGAEDRDDGLEDDLADAETNKTSSAPKPVRTGSKQRMAMDARPVMERFRDFSFELSGEFVREIHLSQRRTEKRTEGGYYWPTSVLELC